MKQFVECCLLPSAICWPHKNTAGVHMNMMASQVSLGLHKHFLLICDVSEETRNLSDLMKYMLWNKASVFYFFPSLLTRQIKTNTTLVRQVFISNFKKKKKKNQKCCGEPEHCKKPKYEDQLLWLLQHWHTQRVHHWLWMWKRGYVMFF